MNLRKCLLVSVVVLFALPRLSFAQTPATNAPPATAPHTNTAIVPVPRGDERSRQRTDVVLKRAHDNPGECDVIFVGDSITQGWETPGRAVWEKFYGSRKALNFGVGGDQTQHVLWRFEHGQLDGLKPKVAVVMIGTNNSGNQGNTEAEILEGVTAIVKQLRERLPDTKIILMGIFPRSRTFSVQRGKLLQVNQALARLADDRSIVYIDIGSRLIENDGSISTAMMRDALHPGEPGYQIWAEAIEPKLKEWLGK